MPTCTIDGKTCEFEGKKMILQVAKDNGVAIPHYCYHEGLSVVASCRICLAEVAAPNPRNDDKVELIPKLVPTCQTPAADGQVVYTKSPKSIANQKAVMEYLLINHPLDCPVCDQAGECYLQDYSYEYGRGASRFEEDKIKQPKKDLGPNVLLYSDRCIMCSRCVRFTEEVSGTSELGIVGRGSSEQIDIFPGQPLDNALSANVIDICPVGALLDKDFLMTQRVWFLKKHAGIDGITASGDNISIEENEGRVYRVKPRTNMDVNKWWISDEIRYGWKHVHSEDRLTTPMNQAANNAGLDPCDWKTALADAADGLKKIVDEHGTGSLGLMVSPMLPCEEAYLLAKTITTLDPDATLAMGPVPIDGQDQEFPGGYTVLAEKCPNKRGVTRAVGQLTDEALLPADQFTKKLAAGEIKGVVITGNYPSDWSTPEFAEALKDAFSVVIDTLPSSVTQSASVLLPGATWVEKAGTFENHANRLQAFDPAIPVLELCRTEGQIALDLAAQLGQADPQRYNVEKLRNEMGDAFVTDVHTPSEEYTVESDMELVEL